MLAAIGTAPAIGWAAMAGPVQERLPWAKFRKTGDYAKLVSAVRTMKVNPDVTSPASWQFWANVHQNHCPHGRDYFLAWHRGYLFLFEQQLRAISKSNSLRVPYWDYFNDPKLPPELLAGSAATNPLYDTRKGNEVGKALVYGAFGNDVTGFEYSKKDAFEKKVEQFHNNVHNLIGGRMATMQSPLDLIFWLHHANVDRLWAAWTMAGQGRQMPLAGQPYWAGALEYSPTLSVKRADAMTPAMLGYFYADLHMPALETNMEGGSGRVAETATGPSKPRVRMPAGAPPPRRGAPVIVTMEPPAMMAPAPPPPPVAAAAPIPFRGIFLGRESRSIRMPLQRAAQDEANAMDDHMGHGTPGDISVILDTVTLTQIGKNGGYFYKLYLDLDDLDTDQVPPENRLIGSVGPFDIAVALSHAEGGQAKIALSAGDVIRRLADERDLDDLGVTFVRVDAGGAPGGSVIGIERVEFRGRLG